MLVVYRIGFLTLLGDTVPRGCTTGRCDPDIHWLQVRDAWTVREANRYIATNFGAQHKKIRKESTRNPNRSITDPCLSENLNSYFSIAFAMVDSWAMESMNIQLVNIHSTVAHGIRCCYLRELHFEDGMQTVWAFHIEAPPSHLGVENSNDGGWGILSSPSYREFIYEFIGTMKIHNKSIQ